MKVKYSVLLLLIAIFGTVFTLEVIGLSQASSTALPIAQSVKAPTAKPVALDGRPQPHKIATRPAVLVNSPLDAHYLDLAHKLGWKSADRLVVSANGKQVQQASRVKFEQWLYDHEYDVYDLDKVEKYLTDQTVKANKTLPDNRTAYSWQWFSLNETKSSAIFWVSSGTATLDSASDVGYVSDCSNGGQCYSKLVYQAAIPRSVLAMAVDIKEAWPDAEFDVSAMYRRTDPFLAVRFDWGRVVIAAWNEPDFKP